MRDFIIDLITLIIIIFGTLLFDLTNLKLTGFLLILIAIIANMFGGYDG